MKQLFFESHIEEALKLIGTRPWSTKNPPPNYENKIKLMMDTEEASTWLKQVIEKGGLIAWDIETEGLKPELLDIIFD